MNFPTKSTSKIILTVFVCTLLSFNLVYGVSAQGTVVKAEASTNQPQVGDTLTVNIIISNVQNLFGVDIKLNWNSSILNLVSTNPQLGVESHSGGVLHESQSFPIEVVYNDASQTLGQYHLLATSTGSAIPSFSGSGTITIVTFNVTGIGYTGLALIDVELSELAADRTVNLVTPSTSVDPVNPLIPEFPITAIMGLLLVLATASVAISTKLLRKEQPAEWKNSNLIERILASLKKDSLCWVFFCL